jgi:predicted nucleic acid-binding Zn ribbon protein
VERVFHPVAVHFKGSGFYTTDYARSASNQDGAKSDSDSGKKKGTEKSGAAASKDSGSGESASKPKDSAPSD